MSATGTPVSHRDYLLVEVHPHSKYFFISHKGNEVAYKHGDHDQIAVIPLPGNYSIVGLLSEIAEKDLTEDEWVQISEAVSKNNLSLDNCLILKKVL